MRLIESLESHGNPLADWLTHFSQHKMPALCQRPPRSQPYLFCTLSFVTDGVYSDVLKCRGHVCFCFLKNMRLNHSAQWVHLQPSGPGHMIEQQFQSWERICQFFLFLVVCPVIPGFSSFPLVWLVHLAVITTIVTKHTPICYMPIKTTNVGMSA